MNVGKGKNPVTWDSGLPVAFTEGRGKRPEAVEFKIRGGKRPDIDALKSVVKFTVGNGKRPDLIRVKFAVKFTVGEGKKPDLGDVGFAVKLKVGVGGPEIEVSGLTVALILGKMPAETEKVGIVVMFRIGKGRLEKGRFVMFVGIRLPDSGYPELGIDTVELRLSWLATGMYKSETVVGRVVVPLVMVVVPRNS